MNEIVYRGESNQPLTNSKLVAEVFGKEHRNVVRDIKNLIEGGVLKNEQTPMFEETTYINEQNKQSYPMFIMNQDGFTLLAMGFNGKKAMEFKLKYIEAFNAMKRQIEQTKPSVPQTYLEALKSLVKSEEEKQQLALENKQQQATILTISKTNVELGNKITEMLPKVSYYDKILQSNATMTVTQIAQDYGMSAMKLNKELESMKIQHKVRGQWILYGKFLTGGYVHSRAVDILRSDGRHDVKYNTEWTTKGRIFLYESLKAKGILPLIEQENTPSDKGTGGTEPSKAAGASQQTLKFD
jgi:Rha family phage regulatory protein